MQPLLLTRRALFGKTATGVGAAALASLLEAEGLPGMPHFAPKAKRVIYLFQSGGPSQMDLFDYKPRLNEFAGKELPESIRNGQRLTGMSASQSTFPVVPSKFTFKQYGPNGAWISELLPHTAKIAGDLTFVRSIFTEAINHDPAVTFLQTGAQIAGRPSIGSWLSYGLGAETQNLPAFVVMISPGAGGSGQPLYDRLWGSGFLPTRYQGVKFRSVGDPVLYLSNPPGVSGETRRKYFKLFTKEKYLNDKNFLRIHRSFIVSKSSIVSISSHEIDIGGKIIPIGRNYLLLVKKELGNKT